MVTTYGMNERIGNLSFPRQESAFGSSTIYSEKTAEIIDEEVMSIVRDAYDRARTMLTDKKQAVELIAERLLKEETITQHDIVELIGPRPFAMPQSYEEFISASGHARHESKDS